MEKVIIPKVYLLIYSKIVNRIDIDRRIKTSYLKNRLLNVRITKKELPSILKEMEGFGIVEKIDKFIHKVPIQKDNYLIKIW